MSFAAAAVLLVVLVVVVAAVVVAAAACLGLVTAPSPQAVIFGLALPVKAGDKGES